MIEFNGKYTTARVMIDNIDEETTSQIVDIVNHPAFTNNISIMPDTHAGAGSVIGFTMPMSDKIVPNTIGVDLGCGMLSIELEISTPNIESLQNMDIRDIVELENLDNDIRDNVPMGFDVRDKNHYKMEKCFPWKEATRLNKLACLLFNRKTGSNVHPVSYSYEKFLKKCEDIKISPKRVINSIGTLGGGNHFIEIGKSINTGNIWITVHSGSRQFGNNICRYWQNKNTENKKTETRKLYAEGIKNIKSTYVSKQDRKRIPDAIKKLKTNLIGNGKTKALDYIEGEDMWGYLTDMIFAQIYAKENRRLIIESVLASMKRRGYVYKNINTIESIHNYINFHDFIIRKGAISSYNNQLMIIPLNMEDGILVCEGKSNPEWNYSAPHGAGRISSRTKARENINYSSEIARNRMENKGIYASVIPTDETKDAYKDPISIENAIKPTAKIVDRIKPIMNLKADEKKKNQKEKIDRVENEKGLYGLDTTK